MDKYYNIIYGAVRSECIPAGGKSYPENNAITLRVFRVCCATLNSNQSKECECVVEFPLTHFNVFNKGFQDMSYLP